MQEIPVEGVDLILANDICGVKVFPDNTIVIVEPLESQGSSFPLEIEEVFSVGAVTRSKSRNLSVDNDSNDLGLGSIFEEKSHDLELGIVQFGREEFVKAQNEDEEVKKFKKLALDSSIDIEKENPCFFIKDEVLLKYSNSENFVQVVVPQKYREMLVEVAHASDMSGHFGVKKTYEKLLREYFWPDVNFSVKKYCKKSKVIQKVGKPQNNPRVNPCKPVLAVCQPCEELTLDCVEPLPKVEGNEYLFTN